MLKAISSPNIRQLPPSESHGPDVRMSRPGSAPGTAKEASLKAEENATGLKHQQSSSAAMSPTTRVIGRMVPSNDSSALVRILKERKLTIHGAHVFHIGAPVILTLASAYASDKISRKVYFDALNMLVRRQGYCGRLQPGQLVALGLSERDARRVPITGHIGDNWTIAGILSGITDVSDFELLQDPNNKGKFFERHFMTLPSALESENSRPPFPNWAPYEMLLDTANTYRTPEFQKQIRAACSYLECEPAFYDPATHVRLRMAAASLQDHHLDLVGPFKSREDMNATLFDIFQVNEPDYRPMSIDDLHTFDFQEPADSPPKVCVVSQGRTEVHTDGLRIAQHSAANGPSQQERVFREVRSAALGLPEQSTIKRDVQIPAERIATQLGPCASGRVKGHERDGTGKTRPPSCVIV